MGTIASDTFSGTSGDELPTYDANWTKHSATGSGVTAIIAASSRARASKSSGAASAVYYHAATPASADYDVVDDVYLASGSTNAFAHALGRINTGANTMYVAGYLYSSGWKLYLGKIVTGTSTQLGLQATSFSSGETRRVKLSMNGSTIEAWKDGSTAYDLQATDSAITATGKSGIKISTPGTPGDTLYAQVEYWEVSEADTGGQPHRKRLGGVGFAAHNAGVW